MVMLHLIRRVDAKIPVLFFRENSQFNKYLFSDEVIRNWNLTVYDFPPTFNEIIYQDGHFDGLGLRVVGKGIHYVAIELHQPTEKYFACALKEIMGRPTIDNYHYPWDLSFMGLKATDKDPILGKIKLNADSFQLGPTKVFLPLRDWTDEDIWEYTLKYQLPINHNRYDAIISLKEFSDKEFNNNYHFACTDCINPELPEMVYCRDLEKEIVNIGPRVDYADRIRKYKEMASYIDWEE